MQYFIALTPKTAELLILIILFRGKEKSEKGVPVLFQLLLRFGHRSRRFGVELVQTCIAVFVKLMHKI